MNIVDLKIKPIWQMTGEEFLYLQEHGSAKQLVEYENNQSEKQYVYGIAGIARLFNCSIPTANRIKASGKIDRAIKQIGRKIVVDSELALELSGRRDGGRRK